ncbi:PREDICTED: probable glycosyltransferase At5g11130 [Tarenaya hassleriana]|uniref:probable glycosyltransferase At5g11130 n=1 Tax=Tarenaya hassleriana TaxID=28532 RepID=UPI00053C2C05|nr:PREDICTED: probable glycosyltransferase At5g11130 [Tarenaya hassleriana]
MADFTCTTPLLLYPSLVLVLFFYSVNHHYRFLPSSDNIGDPSLCSDDSDNLGALRSPEALIYSSFRFPFRTNSSCRRRRGDDDLPSSNNSEKVRWEALERVEGGLAMARAAILTKAAFSRNSSYGSESLIGSVYLNPFTFHQSHREMERKFKIWAYREGDGPLFHKAPVNDIYAIEGQFMDEIETGKSPFAAKHPDEATVFYIPVGIVNIIRFVYRPYTNYARDRLQNIVKDYISVISQRYPYWNRSLGADHFLVSCHDWAPDVTAADPEFYRLFIRVLCNANASEGFVSMRDVSLPEINIPRGQLGSPHAGEPPENRKILAFFAGGPHGKVRQILFQRWKDKDRDVRVHDYLPKGQNYTKLMDQTKFCLCPSGYEVASPRIVESLYSGCIPVIIADSYVLPFSDVLDWKKFSVHIPIPKIPEIKKILEGIPEGEYLRMQRRVLQVQRHFVLNRPSKPFDMLRMVMHSIWLRRLNVRVPILQ